MTVTATVMIQSCCHMPPLVTSLSWFLVTPKSCLPSRKKHRQPVNLLEGENNVPEFHAVPNLTVQTSAASGFNQVPPASMAKAQSKDSVLGLVIPSVHKGLKPKGLVIAKIRCKATHNYLVQFDHLVSKQGVPHQIYIINDVENTN